MANKIQSLHPDLKEGVKTGACSPGVVCDGGLYVSVQVAVDYPDGVYVLSSLDDETCFSHDLVRSL